MLLFNIFYLDASFENQSIKVIKMDLKKLCKFIDLKIDNFEKRTVKILLSRSNIFTSAIFDKNNREKYFSLLEKNKKIF